MTEHRTANITNADASRTAEHYARQHAAGFRTKVLNEVRPVVDSIRTMFGEAVAHRLDEILVQLVEHHGEAVDGYERWIAEIRESLGHNVADAQHDAEHRRMAESALEAEREAHLETLRTLAQRYLRSGKPIPAAIAEAISARDVPF